MLVGGVEVAAQQADPAEHGQGVRLAARVADRPGERGPPPRAGRAPAGSRPGRSRPSPGRSSPSRGPTATPRRRRAPGEPALGPVVAGPQEVHVPELGAGLRHGPESPCASAIRSASCSVASPSSSRPPSEWISASASTSRDWTRSALGIRPVGEPDRGPHDATPASTAPAETAAAPASMTASTDAGPGPLRPPDARASPARPRHRATCRAPARRWPTTRRTAARPRPPHRRAGTAGSAAPGGSRPAGSSRSRGRRIRAPRRALPGPSAPGPPRAGSPPPPRPGAGARRAARTRTAAAFRDGQPSSRSAPSPGRSTASAQCPCDQHVDVDRRHRRAAQHHRVAVEHGAGPEAPTDLGQAPAQRPQRVVGLGEQQRGELGSGSAAAR